MKQLPKDVLTVVSRMKHEMEFVKVLEELVDRDWARRRIELGFQAHARDGLLSVQQYSVGVVGQEVLILPRNSREHAHEVGYSWRTYNRNRIDALYEWGMNHGKPEMASEQWFEEYGAWKEDLGNGLVRIRLMIGELPHPPMWSDSVVDIGQSNLFNPDFLSIVVIIPSICVVPVAVPLNQEQLAVKYNFVDDIIFAREKVISMALAKSSLERNQIIIELIEFFITKPTMLVHSYKMRDSVYTKLEEFMVWIDKCDDIKYTGRIRDMVDRMTSVLSTVLEDPLCVK